MKKLIFIAAFAACAFGINAQLTVNKSGKVQIGTATVLSIPKSVAETTGTEVVLNTSIDSLASLNLQSKNSWGAGAYRRFL